MDDPNGDLTLAGDEFRAYGSCCRTLDRCPGIGSGRAAVLGRLLQAVPPILHEHLLSPPALPPREVAGAR